MGRPLLAVGSGLLLFASLPPRGWWWAGVGGFVLLAWALRGSSWRVRIGYGYLAGVGLSGPGLAWVAGFSAPGFILLVGLEAAFLALAALLAARGRAVLLPPALVVAEWLRGSWPLGGLPLAAPALGQVDAPFTATAALAGPLAVAAVAGLVAITVLEFTARVTSRWRPTIRSASPRRPWSPGRRQPPAVPRDGPGLLATPAGQVGVAISYEVFFPDRTRTAVRAGGQVLVVPTNAASFTTDDVPAQELAAARLRAIETGRAVIQAAPTGYSAVIAPDGSVRSRSELGAPRVLIDDVPPRDGRTPYVLAGDLPVLLLALAALALGAVPERIALPIRLPVCHRPSSRPPGRPGGCRADR